MQDPVQVGAIGCGSSRGIRGRAALSSVNPVPNGSKSAWVTREVVCLRLAAHDLRFISLLRRIGLQKPKLATAG